METLPGTIGKYTVTGIAGRGNMGVVYEGHDPFVDRKVAIKMAGTRMADNRTGELARKLFFNEARAAGALDHPNILRVYEAGENDGQPYMVMEFIEGVQTLKQYAQPETLLPVEQVIELMRQCADALDYAHRNGVIHRDIKPANLMLTASGQLKVCDFGVAQRVRGDETQVLGWFGSPQYMSPEQARDEEVTPQSDLFSYGCVLYELLTGHKAFEAKGITGLVRKVLTEDPEPLRSVRPELPASLEAVLSRCLAKAAAQRWSKAGEIVTALEGVQRELQNPLLRLSDEDRHALVSALPLFAEFTRGELNEVLRVAQFEYRAAGDRLIEAGSDGNALYVICEGAARTTIDGQTIAVLGRGECFGEMSYLQGGRQSATVDATAALSLMRIDRPLREWASLPCQMRFNRVLVGVLVERLRRTSAELARALASGSGRLSG